MVETIFTYDATSLDFHGRNILNINNNDTHIEDVPSTYKTELINCIIQYVIL
jgi:hypothetical protein